MALGGCSSNAAKKLGTSSSIDPRRDGGDVLADDESDGAVVDSTVSIYRDVDTVDAYDAGIAVDALATIPVDANLFLCNAATIAFSATAFFPDANSSSQEFVNGWTYEVNSLTPVNTPDFALVFDNLLTGPTISISAGEVQSDGNGSYEFVPGGPTLTDAPMSPAAYGDPRHFSLPNPVYSPFGAVFGGKGVAFQRLTFSSMAAEIEFGAGCGDVTGTLHVVLPVATNEDVSLGMGTVGGLLGPPNNRSASSDVPDGWSFDLTAVQSTAGQLPFHH